MRAFIMADWAEKQTLLTSELLVVGRDHHRELPGMGIMQTGEEPLLSSGGEKVFLLLMAC